MTSPAAFAQGAFQLPAGAFPAPSLVNSGGAGLAYDEVDPDGEVQPDGQVLPRKGSLILMDSLKQLDNARPGYVIADSMYDGDVGDLVLSDAIARLVQKSGVLEVEDLNYAKVPVDTVADKLGIRAVTVSAGDDADSDAAPDKDDTTPPPGAPKASDGQRSQVADDAQEALDELRKANQLDAEEQQLMNRVSRYGDAYLFVWPVVQATDDTDQDEYDTDGDGLVPLDPDDSGAQIVGVDVYVNSPYTVRAFYDPENPLKMTHVLKSWEWVDPADPGADKPRCRATLYFHDRLERWVTKPGEPADKRESWVPYVEDEGDAWPTPYPAAVTRIPFFHLRNDRPYGRPEHKAAYGPQRLINKLVAAHGVTIDFQIFPQRYMLVDPQNDAGLLNLINPDNPEDEEDDPEGNGYSQLRADPSAVWKLYAQSVGQFQPAEPGTFIQPLDRYIKAISELCGIPLDRFTGYGTPPSGESRRVGNEVLYEKVGNRRGLYEAVVSDAYEFALQLLGYEDVTVDVKWKPLDAAAGIDDWNIVQAKINAGVPVRNALVEAGYPEDEVDDWLLDQDGADLTRRVGLLNSVATAVTGLAAGVSVGMVSPEQAGDIVARIIGQVGQSVPNLEKPVDLHPQLQAMQGDLQNTMRNRQLNEHIASQTPTVGPPGEDGKPTQGPPPNLPPMPAPPPPVQVGSQATSNSPTTTGTIQ